MRQKRQNRTTVTEANTEANTEVNTKAITEAMEDKKMKTLELKKDFFWTGIQDPDLEIFDIIMPTKYGTSYNSYLLKGSEKTALFETAKLNFLDEYMDKLQSLIQIKDIDYIIVNHTEPDHAGSCQKLLEMNPEITVVGSQMAIAFMEEITNMKFKHIKVCDGDTLSLGNKTLRFINAVNLHWPDSIFTYIEEDKTLVTCDAFGAHYSYDKVLLSEMEKEGQEVRDGYIGQVKYYYDAIMSPFKAFMLKAIDRIKDLEIDMICPGHGVVLDKDPWKIVKLSQEWSRPKEANDKKLVVIPYVSAYGYTDALAKEIEKGIKASGDIDVEIYDMVKADKEKVMERLLISDGMLFGTPTMLGDALPPIWDLVMEMFPSICMGKPASAFGAFGWSGEGVPNIIDRLKQLRTKVYGEGLKIRFKPSEAQLEEAFEFGKGFGQQV